MHISTRAVLAASAAAIVAIQAAPAFAQARYDFNLPAQPLAVSLTAVASRSGANIAFKPEVVAGRSAPALSGAYTVDEALGRLLSRSGLAATVTLGGSFLVQPEAAANTPARAARTSAAPAVAVSPQVVPPPTETAVEEVIVTASRRAANLQDLPISVTAVTARDIERAGVTEARNLTQMVPNLTFSRGNNAFHPTIRGVGTRSVSAGDESTVSVYVDGVYQADMASGSFDLLKVERVEVLRGPQGTLFGRNSTGGLINVITPDPTFDLQGQIKGRYGSYDERSLQSYVSTGLTDNLAIDLAALSYRDEGYVKDLVRGGNLGVKETLALRSKLLFRPSDTAKMVLTVNYFDGKDNSAPSYVPLNGNTVGRTGAPNIVLPTAPYQAALDVKPEMRHKDYGASLQTAFEFSPFNVETTLSGQRSYVHLIVDSDASPVFLASNDLRQTTQSFTQELRLISKPGDERLEWIAGIFGFESMGRFAPLISSNTTYFSGRTTAKSVAGFAEATYQVLDNLFIGAGARYTWEERTFSSTRNGVPAVIDAKTSYDKITPRVFIRYAVTPDVNLYATYSEGFKSGVFNTGSTSPRPVRPENIKSFEIGVKAQPASWLRTNLAAFHSDYKDIQLSARDANSTVSTLLNAASGKIKGVEGEVSVVPTTGLDVRLSAAYLDAKYDDFPRAIINTPLPGNNGNAQGQQDVSGARMIRAPKYTFNLGASYTIPMESGTLGLSGNFYHSAKYYWDFQNRLHQPAYTTINGEVSWAFADDRYRVAVWGRNLTNEEVFQQMLPSTLADSVAYEKPRTWGVSLEAKF